MKFSNPLTRFGGIITIALLAFLPSALKATEDKETQRSFASPDDALKALREATAAKDKPALREIFGPEVDGLLTGDDVQDSNNAARFAKSMAQVCHPVEEGENKIIFEVGSNNWPMPIPLVKVDDQWHFDILAGKEEIINRHIGKDELHAIGVCRAYVVAQRQYANMIPKIGGGANYAQKFKSTPGSKDGLYWPVSEKEPASPFGPLVAAAHAEGYGDDKSAGPHPFHGYYFRILMRQGAAAPGGKMNYLSEGVLAAGFALVAYPERWDQSGIMTFIVNQDGKVYQRNLGKKTPRIGQAMKSYNPDADWTLVEADGVDAVSEK